MTNYERHLLKKLRDDLDDTLRCSSEAACETLDEETREVVSKISADAMLMLASVTKLLNK